MKLLIELDVEVDGKISPSRLTGVVLDNLPLAIGSEANGDGDDYFLTITSAEVKEVK